LKNYGAILDGDIVETEDQKVILIP